MVALVAALLVAIAVLLVAGIVLLFSPPYAPRFTPRCDHDVTIVVGEMQNASIVNLADGTLLATELQLTPRGRCVSMDSWGDSVVAAFQVSSVISPSMHEIRVIDAYGTSTPWPSQPVITASEHYLRGVAVDEATDSVVTVFPSAIQILGRDGTNTRVPVNATFSPDWDYEIVDGRLLASTGRDTLVLIELLNGSIAPWLDDTGVQVHGWLRGRAGDRIWVQQGSHAAEYRLNGAIPTPTGRTHPASGSLGRFILAGDAWQWISSYDSSNTLYVECLECGSRIRLPRVSVIDAATLAPPLTPPQSHNPPAPSTTPSPSSDPQ